jgi:hypothetical protein
MELLLNLAWLLLALPAYWLWRRGTGARNARRLTALQFLLTLACALLLLFPVISATDDVHAMRAEMEDSAVGERAVRPTGSDKASVWVNRVQGSPAILPSTSWLPAHEVRLFESCVAHISPLSRPCVLNAGRAPPYSLLG